MNTEEQFKDGEGFDLFKTVFMVIGAKSELHHDIQNYYKQKEAVYYSYYRNSDYYNKPLFQALTTKNMEMVKKVIGIMKWEIENNPRSDISMRLIKKGYKITYNYVIQRKVIEIEDYTNMIMSHLTRSQNLSELMNHFVVMIYLCEHLNKEYNRFSKRLQTILHNLKINERAFEEEQKVIERNLFRYEMKIIDDELIYDFPQKKELFISELFDNKVMNNDRAPLSDKEVNKDTVQQELIIGLPYYFVAYNSLLRTVGLSGRHLITNHKIGQRDVHTLLGHTHMLIDNKKLNKSEQDIFIASGLVMYALVQEYKETREQYLDQLTDKYYYDLQNMKNQFDNEKEEFEEKREKLNQTKKELQKENKGYQNQILTLQKTLSEENRKMEQIQKENNELKENQKELIALREYIFSLKQDTEYVAEPQNTQEVIENLNDKKITIIGGHINWQNKLKEKLKTITFITPDQEGIDFSFLNNMDAVFVQTNYLNHGTYYKVQKVMSKNKVSLFYLSGKDNLELTINEIAEKILAK